MTSDSWAWYRGPDQKKGDGLPKQAPEVDSEHYAPLQNDRKPNKFPFHDKTIKRIAAETFDDEGFTAWYFDRE